MRGCGVGPKAGSGQRPASKRPVWGGEIQHRFGSFHQQSHHSSVAFFRHSYWRNSHQHECRKKATLEQVHGRERATVVSMVTVIIFRPVSGLSLLFHVVFRHGAFLPHSNVSIFQGTQNSMISRNIIIRMIDKFLEQRIFGARPPRLDL